MNPKQETTASEERDYMVRISGRSFRCECGCNVFRKPKPVKQPELYSCNACAARWVGEP